MTILLITPYSLKPLHPRIKTLYKMADAENIRIITVNPRSFNLFFRNLNRLSLGFYDLSGFFKGVYQMFRYRKTADFIYIQDMQFIPLVFISCFFFRKIIYETLDNNVELRFHRLIKRSPCLSEYAFLKKAFKLTEKIIAENICTHVIVNSESLREYFKPVNTELIFYSSPVEGTKIRKHAEKTTALIYLGNFTEEKGKKEMIGLSRRYNKRLFVFGASSNIERHTDNLVVEKRLSPERLAAKIGELAEDYNLIGLSLIKSSNKSYATQEANKDIDYMAAGFPIIGNHRIPTAEKITAGCGVFSEDRTGIEKLLYDPEFYKNCSECSLRVYRANYAFEIYRKKMREVFYA